MKLITILKERLTNPLYKNTLIYTATDALSKGLSFLVLPFISYYLNPDQLGIAANFDVIVLILCLLAGQATVNGMPYFYYERSKEKTAILIFNLIITFSVILILLTGVIGLFSHFLAENLELNVALQALTVVSALSTLLISLGSIVYRLEDKPVTFSILQIVQTVIYLSLLTWLVVGLRQEAVGKIYSIVGANVVMAIIHTCLLYKRKFIIPRIDKESINELLRFGTPLIPHSLSFWIKSGLDKILLTTYCGLTINGLYSMSLSFCALYDVFMQAFSNAYVPYLQERLSNMNPSNELMEKKSIVLWSYKILLLFFVLYFVVLAICWVAITYVLSDKYLGSLYFLPWMLLSLFLKACYSMVVQFPYSQKKTLGLGVITFTCSVVQMLITWILVSNMGQYGINVSAVVGAFLTFILVWWYSNRVYPMPWISKINSKI